MKLADWLADEMERRGLPQGSAHAWLADRLGVTKVATWRYCCNARVPAPEVVIRIWLLTGGKVTPTDLYELPRIKPRRAA